MPAENQVVEVAGKISVRFENPRPVAGNGHKENQGRVNGRKDGREDNPGGGFRLEAKESSG
jgi:hypothetical protein